MTATPSCCAGSTCPSSMNAPPAPVLEMEATEEVGENVMLCLGEVVCLTCCRRGVFGRSCGERSRVSHKSCRLDLKQSCSRKRSTEQGSDLSKRGDRLRSVMIHQSIWERKCTPLS